jgi:2-phosphosulfolactate phosphatase
VKVHGQQDARVRFAWGPVGAAACGGDVVVVVDVLSFSTAVSVAVGRGIEVWPFGWRDERAAAYARDRGAVLAVGRSVAGPGEVSLSPASVLAARDGVRRLVLPSPNGSTIALGLAGQGATVVAGCLRNRAAVARWLAPRLEAGQSVTVVAAGERWPDGSLRPADEDIWGSGAVLAALVDLGAGGLSVEARTAEAAYRAVTGDLPAALHGCASGRELVAAGYAEDVAVAAGLDVAEVVPALADGSFRPA